MNSLIKSDLWKSHVVRFGIPFTIFVVGGSFALAQFTELRYKYSKVKSLRPELERLGLKVDKNVTLESEYESVKNMDISNWENKRIVKPWEK